MTLSTCEYSIALLSRVHQFPWARQGAILLPMGGEAHEDEDIRISTYPTLQLRITYPDPFAMTSSKQSCTFVMVSCPLKFSLDTSHGALWNLMEESQLLNLGAQSTARPLPRAHIAHT